MAKMIGYYGNGQPKYDTDIEREERYQRNWTPTTSYCGNGTNFGRLNTETYYNNNKQHKMFY